MKKLIMLLSLLLPLTAVSQVEEQNIVDNEPLKFRNTMFTGGNLGLQFGTVTMVDISPQFGYYVLENISVGIGLTYQYIADRRYVPTAQINVYGGRVFTNLHFPFYNSIYGHAEFEYFLYNTNVFSATGKKEWIEVPGYLLGIGYRQRVGGRSAINLMILWNFNESQYSLYRNPVIRVGFDLGL